MLTDWLLCCVLLLCVFVRVVGSMYVSLLYIFLMYVEFYHLPNSFSFLKLLPRTSSYFSHDTYQVTSLFPLDSFCYIYGCYIKCMKNEYKYNLLSPFFVAAYAFRADNWALPTNKEAHPSWDYFFFFLADRRWQNSLFWFPQFPFNLISFLPLFLCGNVSTMHSLIQKILYSLKW